MVQVTDVVRRVAREIAGVEPERVSLDEVEIDGDTMTVRASISMPPMSEREARARGIIGTGVVRDD